MNEITTSVESQSSCLLGHVTRFASAFTPPRYPLVFLNTLIFFTFLLAG